MEQHVTLVSCVKEDALLAVGMIQVYPGQTLKMKDMIDTFLSLAGVIIQKNNALRELKESDYQNTLDLGKHPCGELC